MANWLSDKSHRLFYSVKQYCRERFAAQGWFFIARFWLRVHVSLAIKSASCLSVERIDRIITFFYTDIYKGIPVTSWDKQLNHFVPLQPNVRYDIFQRECAACSLDPPISCEKNPRTGTISRSMRNEYSSLDACLQHHSQDCIYMSNNRALALKKLTAKHRVLLAENVSISTISRKSTHRFRRCRRWNMFRWLLLWLWRSMNKESSVNR